MNLWIWMATLAVGVGGRSGNDRCNYLLRSQKIVKS